MYIEDVYIERIISYTCIVYTIVYIIGVIRYMIVYKKP